MKALVLACLICPFPVFATTLTEAETACLATRSDCPRTIASALTTATGQPQMLGMAVGSLAAIAVRTALAQPETRYDMADSLLSLAAAAPEPVQARNLTDASRAIAAGRFDATVLRAVAGSPSRQPAWLRFDWFRDMPGLRLGLARRQ